MRAYTILFLIFISSSVYSGPINWLKQKTCGSALLQSVAGMFSKKSKFQNQINIFAKSFDADVAIDYVKNLPKRERADFFDSLVRLSDTDEVFGNNVAALINKSLDEKLITRADLSEVVDIIHGKTLYYFNNKMTRVIATVDVHPEKLAILDSYILQSDIPITIGEKYKKIFIETNISIEELELIIKRIEKLPSSSESISLIENYIRFVNQYNQKVRLKAFAYIDEVVNGSTPLNSKYTKKFFKDYKNLEKYEIDQYEKLLAKYQKDNDGILTPALRKRAADEAKAKRMIKERLKYGCNARDSKRLSFEDKALIAKRKANFTKFSAYSSVPLAIGSYAFGHWSEDKDKEWFGKLGYEVVMGMLYSIVGSKMTTNTSNNFAQKFWESYKFNALADVGAHTLYTQMFNAKESEIEKKIEELKNDPEFKAKMKILAEYVEKEHIYEKFKAKIEEVFQINTPEGMNAEDIEQLSPEDLEHPEIRDLVFDLIVEQIYEEKSGELLVTGNAGIDRYSFNRLYYFLSIPKGVAIGVMMYRVMCMTPNPQRGMAIAISMLLFNKLVINPIEYKFRDYAIGQ